MTAAEMFARDAASAALGMHVVELAPQRAVVTMLVREDMLNGFAVAHGGIIFSVADTAFALACNDGSAVTLAAGADITFLRPVRAGQELCATAVVRSRSGRSGIVDVTVTDETGVPVAEFRGRSRSTNLEPSPASR